MAPCDKCWAIQEREQPAALPALLPRPRRRRQRHRSVGGGGAVGVVDGLDLGVERRRRPGPPQSRAQFDGGGGDSAASGPHGHPSARLHRPPEPVAHLEPAQENPRPQLQGEGAGGQLPSLMLRSD